PVAPPLVGRGAAVSPGTRYRHYAPKVPVRLFSDIAELPRCTTGELEAGVACVCSEKTAKAAPRTAVPAERSAREDGDCLAPGRSSPSEAESTVVTFESFEDLSANLYRWLWKLENKASAIWIELPADTPEFRGLRDRLFRAAGAAG
ncbi:MAG: Sua5 family C-terminal domain-containing protein, partial [Spirochaetales bacterium]